MFHLTENGCCEQTEYDSDQAAVAPRAVFRPTSRHLPTAQHREGAPGETDAVGRPQSSEHSGGEGELLQQDGRLHDPADGTQEPEICEDQV